eukprot:scaffold10550_cov271-Chaetoceros_neogracile.AAC.63
MKLFAALQLTLVVSVTHAFNVNSALPMRNSISRNRNHSPLLPPSAAVQKPFTRDARRSRSIALKAASTTPASDQVLDTEAITKYGIALVAQLSLISGFFYALDAALPLVGMTTLPYPVTWIMCYAFSLKSRTFNPLNNKRPDRKKAMEEGKSDGFKDRNQPSWTPPGVVFPIMWLLIIAPLRATSSTIIINALDGYLSIPLMSLMLHLACGDVWNTINNTEKRYGTAVLGIGTVYLSALFAAWQYYQVDSLAGKLLGATAIWLTIAGTLIFEIWRLNPDENGEKATILPTKVAGEESLTTFAWGAKKEE